MPHIIILGGGFAGLYTARGLKGVEADVTVVDQHNYHLFQPLLYQVAMAALNPSDIAAPIRGILRRQKNVRVVLGEATAVDANAKRVQLADGSSLAYDHLVVATGATHSYFGHPEWERFAPGLKTIDDALEIRRRVLTAFEAAERETDPERQKTWLTFVVIGGGPTGVELAGALSEIARQTMVRDFRNIHSESARVILVEGRERVLPPYPAGPVGESAQTARGAGRGGNHQRDRHGRERSRGLHRRAGDPDAHDPVGRRRSGLPSRPLPRRPSRPRGPRAGGAGPHDSGAQGRLRHRRPRRCAAARRLAACPASPRPRFRRASTRQ